MKTRRTTFMTGLAGGLCAALLFAIPAMAGVGDNLIIGAFNQGNQTTTLDGTVDGPLFKVFNHQGGGSAAVRINSAGPPFATNSSKRVLNFNSDLLDGLDGTEYQILTAADAATDVSNSNGVKANTSITAPTNGRLVMWGVVDVVAAPGFTDSLACRLVLDDDQIETSPVDVSVNWDADVLTTACPTIASVAVDAGQHAIDLEVAGWSNASLLSSSLQVLFVPTP